MATLRGVTKARERYGNTQRSHQGRGEIWQHSEKSPLREGRDRATLRRVTKAGKR